MISKGLFLELQVIASIFVLAVTKYNMQVFKQNTIAILILSVLCCCNNKPATQQTNRQTTIAASTILDSSQYINTVTKVPYLDTITYSTANTSYSSREEAVQKDSPSYYIDTFSQVGSAFRLIYKSFDPANKATLEKLVNGQWRRRIEFEKSNGAGEITHSADVNNDGYKDMLRESRFSSDIYLFNPSINNFIDTVCGDLNYDVFLIDSMHHIYCDFQEYRGGCGSIFSTLYTYQNYQKYYLYKLELYNCDDEEHSRITKLILSTCTDGNLENLKEIKTYKLPKPISTDTDHYFDNKKFWKKEYKQLPSYN